ncbi:MAG: gamma-glutamyltransferase, partial [Amylibacter sp.]|nr:gamma-glutamyltransferase [Amylibacter sp.]
MSVLTRIFAVLAVTLSPVSAQDLTPAATVALDARNSGKPTTAQKWMISTANPIAAQIGADILRQGGTAADAMVAVQATLGLLEPQSSGLGGGAFLVWYDGATGKVTTLDGRETAPLAATPTLFQDENGEPLKFFDAVVGGRSVGTPGTPMLMAQAHKKWGNQPWPDLLAPAKSLAADGFTVSPRMAESVSADLERLSRFPATAAYFLPKGTAIKSGDTLKNQPYAETLSALQSGGPTAFYTGKIAQNIVATVHTAAGNPGVLSLVD